MFPREGSHWGGACARVRFPTFFAREYPPMRIERLLLLAVTGLSTLFLVACASPAETPLPPTPEQSTTDSGARSVATATTLPTATPYAVQPTLTPVPSPTVYPTATPYSEQQTNTPQPTLTPFPTATPYADATAYPLQPTLTPLPTSTPRPTYTPLPTATPYSTPSVPGGRTVTVARLKKHPTEFWLDRRPTLLVGCRADVPQHSKGSDSYYTFSSDGKFDRNHFLVAVSGFSIKNLPMPDKCYEMVVKYRGQNRFCYWVETNYLIPVPTRPSLFGESYCRGWRQDTPEFKLVSSDAVYRISRWSDKWKSY